MLSPKYTKKTNVINFKKHKKKFSIIYDYLNNNIKDQLIIIDPNNFLCKRENCNIFKNGIILYKDQFHYTLFGAELIFKKITKNN